MGGFAITVIPRLASSKKRNDEVPNVELAVAIVKGRDVRAVRELVEHLRDENRAIQHDCVKVLYEIGEREPGLIAPFADEFIDQVSSKNNRMVWGAMTALGTIARVSADAIWRRVGEVIEANDAGSVITQDWGIRVLAAVSSTKKGRATRIFPYLIAFLGKCIPRDVPKHAESMLIGVHDGNREKFVRALKAREKALKPSQMARLKKVYRTMEGRQTRQAR